MDADEIAKRSARAMWANDDASKWLGLSLDEVRPGYARLSMTVARRHTQGHDMCHGGFITTLADSAFAFACNSYNQNAVAQTNDITFVAPGRLGDILTATCEEQSKTGRSGVYDATVTNQNGEIIALMRGRSRTIKGRHFEEETT